MYRYSLEIGDMSLLKHLIHANRSQQINEIQMKGI